MRIIASVTTTPNRIDKITNTLVSIINQCYDIDIIYLIVPYTSHTNSDVYIIPPLIYNLIPKIEIIRCDDYGPVSKVLSLLSRMDIKEDVWIMTFDDDIIYQKNHLSNLVNSIKDINTNEVYGLAGFNIDKDNNFLKQKNSTVDILEGSNTILYHRSIFKSDFTEYINLLINNINCRYSDDIIICNYLAKHKIKRNLQCLCSSDIYYKYMVTYSSTNDALCNGKGGIILIKKMRYKRVIQILKDLDIHYL